MGMLRPKHVLVDGVNPPLQEGQTLGSISTCWMPEAPRAQLQDLSSAETPTHRTIVQTLILDGLETPPESMGRVRLTN
eukprot:9208025-Pyramimonas_sp.AAC.1